MKIGRERGDKMVVKSEKGWTFRDKRRREENAFEMQEVMDDAVMKIDG